MTAWRYIKGSEKDFEGAPDWCKQVIRQLGTGNIGYEENCNGSQSVGDKIWWPSESSLDNCNTLDETDVNGTSNIEIIAQREPVATNDSKYNRPCKGITIDVYDVLKAFNVTCPALQHLIKKALAVGQRGHKDASEDLKDILASAKRAIELSEGDK